jgi:hypothetical protein
MNIMKKTIFSLPVAALVAVGLVACSDSNPTGLLAPDAYDAKATSVDADVLGSFTSGEGTGDYEYTGNVTGVYCKADGLAYQTVPIFGEQRVPGQDQFCAQSGSTQYTVVWPARYVDNKSTTHLNFDEGANVHETPNLGVVGQGWTDWAPVFEAGTTTQVGEARLDLSKYTHGEFVPNAEGYACLLQDPAVTLEWRDGEEDEPELGSLCW